MWYHDGDGYNRGEVARARENRRLQQQYEAKQARLKAEADAKLAREQEAAIKAQLIAAKLLRKASDEVRD